MRTVQFAVVREVFQELGVAFECIGEPPATVTIASLFAPIPGGFYFYNGRDLPALPEGSLALVGADCDRSTRGGSALLVVTIDPQLAFYRILSRIFGRRSTGAVAATSVVDPAAQLGRNVEIEDFCVIEACVLGDDVIVGSHSRVHAGAVIGPRSVVESHSVIGATGVAWVWDEIQEHRVVQPQLGGVRIGADCFLGANTIVVRGSTSESTEVGDESLFAPGCRIGHGTIIGRRVHLGNNVTTGGNSVIGDRSFVGSAAVLRPKVRLHARTIVGAGAVVVRDTSAPGFTLVGVPAKETATSDRPSGMPRPAVAEKGVEP